MGKWNSIEFRLRETARGFAIEGLVSCGNILFVKSNGVSRALSVGGGLRIDTDKFERIKFFKGCTPGSMAECAYGSNVVSSLIWNNREWKLEKSGDVLILRCNGLYVLFITPAGVYRSLNCSGTGLPCDEQGRVMVLK